MDYNGLSMIIGIISLLVSIIGAWSALKGHYLTLTSWSQSRKIAKMYKEIDFIIRMRDSDREFSLFVLRYAFMVSTLVGAYMMFSGLDTSGQAHKLNLFIRFVIGTLLYFFSAYALTNVVRIKNHANTLDNLNKKLEKLGVETDISEESGACVACGRQLARNN
jgi:hypothetical protein